MRISQLAEVTGVPLATVKFYLRERLLPPGRPTGATRAEYGERHVERLRLVRALVEVGGLPLASVRRVVAVLDQPSPPVHEVLEATVDALGPAAPEDVDTAGARAVVEALGWRVHHGSSALRQLAVAVASLEAVGAPAGADVLTGYARAVADLAEQEVARVPAGPPEAAAEFVVVGTVLYEPVLLALRRLAHEDASARRFTS